MVELGWKTLTEQAPGADRSTRLVSAPVEHQGVRIALRAAYARKCDIPPEWRDLLAQLD